MNGTVRRLIGGILGGFLLLLSIAACDYIPFGYAKIGDILESPAAYEGQEVKIRGEVTSVMKIPFIGIRTYKVRDSSGEILVTTEADPPRLHKKVRLTGIVTNVAVVDGEGVGVHVRELKRQ